MILVVLAGTGNKAVNSSIVQCVTRNLRGPLVPRHDEQKKPLRQHHEYSSHNNLVGGPIEDAHGV
jgi:hypothetical protein